MKVILMTLVTLVFSISSTSFSKTLSCTSSMNKTPGTVVVFKATVKGNKDMDKIKFSDKEMNSVSSLWNDLKYLESNTGSTVTGNFLKGNQTFYIALGHFGLSIPMYLPANFKAATLSLANKPLELNPETNALIGAPDDNSFWPDNSLITKNAFSYAPYSLRFYQLKCVIK